MKSDEALAMTAKMYEQLVSRRAEIKKRDEYFRGKQPLQFASDKWREYNASRYENFSDNWCGPVGNSPAERLRITGFRLDDDPMRSGAEKLLWDDWQHNNMEMQSSQGILSSIVAARSSVLVWGSDEDVPISTWERADQVIVGYDPERPGRRVAALKAWWDDDLEYATLYADKVWKWQRPRDAVTQYAPVDVPEGTKADGFFNRTPPSMVVDRAANGGWVPRQSEGDDTWPIDNPMGVVPIVEYPNRPMLGGDPLSDIAGTMAMQDAINLLWAYLFAAADFASMPARVVMGQEPPKIPILNEQGQKVGEKEIPLEKIARDRILWLTGENTKVGQWDAARLDAFTQVIETAVTHVAAQTRTPPHYLILGKGLVNVNAEGMKTAETGLVMKSKEAQLFYGPAARETFRLMALVRNDKKLAKACRLGAVQWRDAENHSEAQLVDALLKLQQIGFPFEWLAERYGLSQTELARVVAMKEREAEQDPLTTMVRQAPMGPERGPAADSPSPPTE